MRMGFIDADACFALGEEQAKSGYGEYVMDVAKSSRDRQCASSSPAGPGSSAPTTSARSAAAPTRRSRAREVVVLDLLTYAGTRTNLAGCDVEFVHGDIRDADTVAQVLAGADVVIHFAAESHVDRSIAGAADFVSTNVVGTQVLLAGALTAGVDRFVHVSTDEVYGSIEEGAWSESHPLEPNSPYSASKGGLGPARPRLPPHAWPARLHYAVLQQLRAPPGSGCVSDDDTRTDSGSRGLSGRSSSVPR